MGRGAGPLTPTSVFVGVVIGCSIGALVAGVYLGLANLMKGRKSAKGVKAYNELVRAKILSWQEDDCGVSHVFRVIFMVSFTLLLTCVVFVLVNDLGAKP